MTSTRPETSTPSETKRPAYSAAFIAQIAVAFFAFILIGANDAAVGVLIPSIQKYYSVDKATVSLMFLCSTAGYLCAAFLTGLLTEKFGSRGFLLLGAILFTCSATMVSLVPPFSLFALALFPLGFGVAVLDAGLNVYVAALSKNAALLNYLHAFFGLGALLSPLIASAFLEIRLPWNAIYILWTILGLVLLVAMLLTFRMKRGAAADAEKQANTEENVLFATLKLRIVWIAAFFLLLYVGLEISLGNWIFSYLTEDRHLSTLVGGWVNSGYWLGLTLGRVLLGQFIARIGEKQAIQLCVIGVVIGVLVAWLAPFSIVVALALCWIGFCLGPIFPTVISLMSQIVVPRLFASAVGFLASLGSMGAALFPWLAGNLIQVFGLWILLPYAAVVTVMMLLLWLILYSYPQRASEA